MTLAQLVAATKQLSKRIQALKHTVGPDTYGQWLALHTAEISCDAATCALEVALEFEAAKGGTA